MQKTVRLTVTCDEKQFLQLLRPFVHFLPLWCSRTKGLGTPSSVNIISQNVAVLTFVTTIKRACLLNYGG